MTGAVIARVVATLACAAVLVSGAARAQDMARLQPLFEALRLGDTIAVMRDEGVAYGREIGSDMLPEADMDSWLKVVEQIHRADRMRAIVEARFAEVLEGEDLDPMLTFLQSPLGQDIVSLEVAARRAFLNPAIEAAARDNLERRRDAGAPVLDLIEQMIADGDLVERNVSGALNSNLMFYNGLVDGGAMEMSQDDILSDVWSQEDSVRREARDWLQAFLLMAYEPLERDELQRYVRFYQSPAGEVLNRAMFDAFDGMYEDLSYILGRAVARHMQSEKL